MRQAPGANYSKVELRSGGGAVSIPADGGKRSWLSETRKNDNDVWFPVYWQGYKGYLNQNFLTPVQ
jgi:hypothetical protein